MEFYLVSGSNYNICKSTMFGLFYKDRQLMLGLHLVSITLHGRFTISIERD